MSDQITAPPREAEHAPDQTAPGSMPSAPVLPPTETETVVPTAVGDLGAIVRVPAEAAGPVPGVVLVDGSGDGDRYAWGGWPEWLAEAGSIVLRHDKPGCGGSPGHWTQQTLEDRAHETLAALRVLREHPGTAGQPVGLYGISQGGWVALLAAALKPDAVDFVICHSGPGTTPAEQERDRIGTWLRAEGHDEAAMTEAMAWVDRRFGLMRDGTSPEAILAEQQQFADRPWFGTALVPYDSEPAIAFISGMLDFDPRAVMPDVRCPVLALFGAADTLVPAHTNLRAYAEHLPSDVRHGYAVFPQANHGLFVADPVEGVDRRDQLAPAYLPTVTAFLADQTAS